LAAGRQSTGDLRDLRAGTFFRAFVATVVFVAFVGRLGGYLLPMNKITSCLWFDNNAEEAVNLAHGDVRHAAGD
jgi:hypothetical protein